MNEIRMLPPPLVGWGLISTGYIKLWEHISIVGHRVGALHPKPAICHSSNRALRFASTTSILCCRQSPGHHPRFRMLFRNTECWQGRHANRILKEVPLDSLWAEQRFSLSTSRRKLQGRHPPNEAAKTLRGESSRENQDKLKGGDLL